MPELLDYSEFCEDLKEVTTPKIFEKRKFHPEGLFSEQIFGPLNNYTCQCGIYYGVSKADGTCGTCGVDITTARERRERFAKISLPIKIVNPLFYDLIVDLGGARVKELIDKLIKDETSILCKDGEDFVIIHNEENIDDYDDSWEGLEAIYELVKSLSEQGIQEDIHEWKKIYNNLDKLLIKDIIVLPPELRPTSMKANVNELDEINRFYTHILMKKQVIEFTVVDVMRDKKLFYQYFRQLQKNVHDLYLQILTKLSKKEGLIRGNILGKRIDFSGRGVITPDPTIGIDECIVPYVMFLELFKLEIAKRLIELEKFKLLNNAIDFIEECIKTENPVLFNVCQEVNQGKVCLLNRQPSLHRLSVLGFYMRISFDKVIKIHPLICPPLNSDFDGDSIAIYIPISEDSIEETKEKILANKNLVNPANDGLSMTPSQDMVLGIYFLTNNKFEKLLDKINYKGKEITESQKIFNECLPEDYPVIDYPVSKKQLASILNDVMRNYDNQTTVNVLDNVKKIGFKYSTIYGSTLSLGSCKIEGLEDKRDEIYSTNDVIQQLNQVNSDEIKEIIRNNFSYAYMIDSGARGDWDQIKQLVFTRGFVSNFKGKILPKPIKNNLINGLTQEEFFDSTYGCRKGLMDVAINTGTSGYLSRKLNMALMNLQVNDNLDDCGTEDYFNLYVKNEYDARMLIHRYYKNDSGDLEKITYDNYKDIIGKTIELRSPLFCKNHELCKTCYGGLYDIINTRFVGIVSAQSLGETNTQMILRTFHTSLRNHSKIRNINGKSYRIDKIYDMIKQGKDFYTFSCSPKGEIEVSKVIDAHKDRFEKQFVKVTLDNGKVIECTLDHEWIMRDGSSKEAKDLIKGDSLMPIYFSDKNSDNNKKYRAVKQNTGFDNYSSGKYDLVYHLSSKHDDSKVSKNLDRNKKIARHHIDKNHRNDYPTNILLVNEGEHLKLHKEDAINSPNRINTYVAVSESNKRRVKDKEWLDKFNRNRNRTLSITYPPEKNSEDKKKWFEENPEMRYHCTRQARYSTACVVINKVKELGLPLTNINYNKIRETFGDKGKGYVTFNYVLENHSELVQDFEIIEEEKKSSNQLQAEYRANLILNTMKNRNLDLNEENFDKINEEIYKNPRTRWSKKAIKKFSPNCLDELYNNHKVTNVEFIELDDYEEFYDLTVDSEYANFALDAGIFIHNSGVANVGKSGETDSLLQQDIVADLSTTSKLLHGEAKNYNYNELVTKLFDIYNHSRQIHYVHFECLVSQMMWAKGKKWRLLEDRDKVQPEYYSVQSVPTLESWLLGLSFSSPKKHIIEGIFYSDSYRGIIDDLLCGERIS